jgi:hypothetical protein
LAAAVLTFWLYRRQGQFSAPWRYILPTLRFVGLFLLFTLLLSPFLVLTMKQEDKPTLVVYLDKSASAASQTEALYKNSLNDVLSSLKEKYQIRIYPFADKIYQDEDTVKGFNATDLGQISAHINDGKDSRSVSAAIVVSDGIQNRGISPLVLPLHSNPVIHCIGLGDTISYDDLRITGIQVNETVFLGSEFPLEVQLQCDAAISVPFKLELYEGRSVTQSVSGIFERGNTFKRIPFSIQGKRAGLHQYRVVVSALPGERNLVNNQATAVTEVVDDRKKITIVSAASHPDLGAIKRLLNGNARYQVSMADPGLTPNAGSADIFIVHGMPVNEKQAAWLKDLADAGKSFFHISSVQTRRNLLGNLPGGIYPANASRTEDVMAAPVGDFTEIAFEPEVIRRLETFPPLHAAYGKWQVDATQKVFMKQRIGNVQTDYPLYYFRDINKLRTVWLCGEGFWRWCIKEFSLHENHMATESLIFQSLQFLAASNRSMSFELKPSKNEYEPGEAAVLQATWLDAAGNRDNNAPCELTLEGDNGFRSVLPMARYNNAYRLETSGLMPGQYKATARLNKTPASTATTLFYVRPLIVETAQSQANHDLLRKWASKYRGIFVREERIEDLAKILASQDTAKPLIYSETKITELIHAKWFFVIIILCFSLEWILRKYLGSY